MSLVIQEHPSSSYGPRTTRNASTSDVTAAFAFDYSTRGEALTKVNAKDKYVAIPPHEPDPIGVLTRFCAHKMRGAPVVINVAGNGINTMGRYGFSQQRVNQAIFEILRGVAGLYPIRTIVSGGQTGADIAGIIAAVALGIPAFILMPKGFKQRNLSGIDEYFTEELIRQQVMTGVSELV